MDARHLALTVTLVAALGACGDADTQADGTARAKGAERADAQQPRDAARDGQREASPDLVPADWVSFVERRGTSAAVDDDADAERLELLRRYGELGPDARARFDAELLRALPPDDLRISGALHGRAYPAAWLAPDEPGAPPPSADGHP